MIVVSYHLSLIVFFFFKQKTAYEMRISDWSSDVCSSDLGVNILYRNKGDGRFEDVAQVLGFAEDNHAVGAAWGDYDNDGWLDLFVTAYTGKSGAQQPANRLYRNLGGKGFVDVLDRKSTRLNSSH